MPTSDFEIGDFVGIGYVLESRGYLVVLQCRTCGHQLIVPQPEYAAGVYDVAVCGHPIVEGFTEGVTRRALFPRSGGSGP